MFRKIAAVAALLVAVLMVAACDEVSGTEVDKANRSVNDRAVHRKPYLPRNDVEFKNYNAAQKLYDDPNTIIWCSTTWGNPSAPIVTVPVAGKLTSSSTTFFQPERAIDVSGDGASAIGLGTARSVDGLFHPNPPQYRYGFTPGGQYVDFFTMPTLCTTALTKFQRQKTQVDVSYDSEAAKAQKTAEDALKQGRHGAAQRALENALGGR